MRLGIGLIDRESVAIGLATWIGPRRNTGEIMRKLAALCAFVAAGMCLAGTACAGAAKLFCVTDKGENVPFNRFPYVSDLVSAYHREFGFDMTVEPSGGDPNTRLLVFSADHQHCARLKNGACENITYTVRKDDSTESVYLIQMVATLQKMNPDKQTGNAMCWRTWNIINGVQ